MNADELALMIDRRNALKLELEGYNRKTNTRSAYIKCREAYGIHKDPKGTLEELDQRIRQAQYDGIYP